MSAKDKRLKTSLVHTRQVISNKFRKLNRNRILHEKELESKYAPITDSIEKLIETKNGLYTQKNISHANKTDENEIKNGEDEDEIELENGMDIDNDDLMSFDEDDDEAVDLNDGEKEKSQPTKLDKKYLKKNKSQKHLESQRKLLSEKRKGQRKEQNDFLRAYIPEESYENIDESIGKRKVHGTNQYDVVRIYAPETDDNNNRKILFHPNRKLDKKPQASLEKIIKSTRNDNAAKRKMSRKNKYDEHRLQRKVETPVKHCSKRKIHEILDSENYVERATKHPKIDTAIKKCSKRKVCDILDSENIGCATKRRKIDAPVKQSAKRKIREILDSENVGCAAKRFKMVASVKQCSKRKIREILEPENYDSDGNFVEHRSKRRKVESKRKPKVILSLDDYNDKGDFIGIATKRRKIEITPMKLAESLQDKKKQSQKKNRRIKYDGKCLEKTFIPYAENIVYEYYDDPNELVERLMLLVSSKSAGNTNHDQEINSIVEELRERSIIQ